MIALIDHSRRRTMASGLSAGRFRAQLELIGELNAGLWPFRILSGIEVDILDHGSPDQTDELLRVVVASVHSELRMPSAPMTATIGNPHSDVPGHCTGRLLTGRGRPAVGVRRQGRVQRCRDRSVRTRPTICCGWLSRSAAFSRSTPTRTHPASLTGRRAAAAAPNSSASGPDRAISTRSAPP
jgi:hypothetical protein